MTDKMVEKVARAICWKNGMDPDKTLGDDGQNFLWMEYEDQAKAAIGAVLETLAIEADQSSAELAEAFREAIVAVHVPAQ